MEIIEDTPLLKFNKNTLSEIRKEFKLSHDEMVKILDNFQEWISKQQHFTCKEFDRHYLESCLINTKGSLEKAKMSLDKFCSMKTLLPDFFSKNDAKKELKDTSGFLIHGVIPRLLKDNYRLYVVKLISCEFDSSLLMDYFRFSILIGEYVKKYDYSIGVSCFVDCTNVNVLSFVTNINILDLRNSMSIFTEGSNVRVKSIHILSSSKGIDAFVTLLKQVITPKLASRIHVHKTLDSVYKHIPKEYFPKEYGGDELTTKEIHENWMNGLSTPENVAFFKQINNARCDEKYRLTETYNDQFLGLPGSFRTLNVD